MASRTCSIHFEATNLEEEVISCSETTFERVQDYTKKWTRFVCQQGDAARHFEPAFGLENIAEADEQGLGLHRKCYNRFTDRTRLRRFEERVNERDLIFTVSAVRDEDQEPSRKKLRSSCDFGSSTPGTEARPTRCSNLFPVKCVFCKCDRKDIRDRVSGKRTREPLKKCEATLLHHLEAKFPEMLITAVPKNGALILDGMAVIQQLADKIPATFGDLSTFIFRHIIKLSCFYAASRVDFVCDKYSPLSIKDNERRRRSSATGCLLRALNDSQKTPNQFRKFLMSGKNKECLGIFLMTQWKKLAPEEFFDKTVLSMSHGCFRLSPQDDMTGVVTETVQELTSDHEEADTLVLLHAKHASGAFPSVTIKTPDRHLAAVSCSPGQIKCRLVRGYWHWQCLPSALCSTSFRHMWNCAFNCSSVSTCFYWL